MLCNYRLYYNIVQLNLRVLHKCHISMMCISWSAKWLLRLQHNLQFIISVFAAFALSHSTPFCLTTLVVYSEFNISNTLFCFFFSIGRGMGQLSYFQDSDKGGPLIDVEYRLFVLVFARHKEMWQKLTKNPQTFAKHPPMFGVWIDIFQKLLCSLFPNASLPVSRTI